jgi:AcrR family transcriptional regulator
MGLKERREREKEERRAQILDAARDLLLEKGMTATSINQIAKKAELGVGTIYFYYRSKEELFAALQEEGLELLYRDMETVIAEGKDPIEKLESIAWVYLAFSRQKKEYFDIINYFLSSSDQVFAPGLKSQVDHHGRINLGLVERVLEEGVETGWFRSINSRRHAVLIWATLHGLIQFQKFRNTILGDENYDDLYRFVIHELIEGIRKTSENIHTEDK